MKLPEFLTRVIERVKQRCSAIAVMYTVHPNVVVETVTVRLDDLTTEAETTRKFLLLYPELTAGDKRYLKNKLANLVDAIEAELMQLDHVIAAHARLNERLVPVVGTYALEKMLK